MLRLALLFLVIALVAAFFGFYEVVPVATLGARIFALVFIVLAIVFFATGSLRGRTPRDLI
jgi:uncharacterized membrane protein YtjA (UPF0391 family)